ncbi:peptide synthase [Pseudoxanthomonas broegbernensis]|uniref:Peptide synthase n=1 Tax=Pseudoxanthomonas broegbernensis TaxID=83619 RepID=A0A7V8GNH6_9GAMM|nr:fatty acid CoA ligase family protein [Pseudoxanthomonas broegbernensis]KAF1686997.1 peptide synthase [Pseudoxanthomonas broegbernensis]MBB6065387.1 acyl-CoA synthetase (AMP-forming)/AMP-acid ligase II [Pseudoxanthomonas broegbernensis]
MSDPCNIAAALPRLAAAAPDRVAMHCPGRDGGYALVMTYAQLDARSNALAAGLAGHGIGRGMRTVVMVRPSPEFFALMFALFKAGAVPVLVDPGIDRRALKQCLDEARPQAFVGIPLAHVARLALGWARSARCLVTVGRRWGWGGTTLARIERAGAAAGPQLADTAPDEVAAILFTSGSTGVPKGVVYRHRHFVAQIDMMRQAFGIQAGGVDLPTFPPFALFDPALGLTSVIPDMDPTRPARADPRKLHAAIARFGATQLFGSPALMKVLADHGAPLPTLRRVTSAGAPVPPEVVARMRALLPDDAQFWTPYGATECLPVAVIEGRELERTRAATEAGAGTCVGRPVPPNEVRIVAIDDAPIADWSGVRELAPGQVGEITVAGPTATDGYFNREAATRAAKIAERRADGSVRVVHRMGDVGYFDAEGRLWFCGRKTQRVEAADGPLYTEQAEPVFNVHPQVRRTALVGVGAPGAQVPVLCVELAPGVRAAGFARIEDELRQIGARHPHTARIGRFLRHPGFPVDIRHNAKIGREALARWAAASTPLARGAGEGNKQEGEAR